MLIREKLRKLFLGKFTQLWADRLQDFFAQQGGNSRRSAAGGWCGGWGSHWLDGGLCGLDEFRDGLHFEEFRNGVDGQSAKFTATCNARDDQANHHGATCKDDRVFQKFNGLRLEGIEGDLPCRFGSSDWFDWNWGGVFRHEIKGKEAKARERQV